MKKTGKVKKFAGGGLMDAISRMQGDPRRNEMVKMSIAEQVAKMPRGNMDAMAEEMLKPRAPRGGFLSGMKTEPMRVGERMDASTAKLLAGPTPSASVSEVSNFMRKPGNSLRAGLESIGQPSTEVAQEAIGRMRRPASSEPSRFNRVRESVMYKKGGKVSSASSRGDGIATKGKTKGRMI